MWFVKYGDSFLHDPRVGLTLQSTNPTVELNTSTEFTFSMTIDHPMYDSIREYDPDNPVVVYQGESIIYKGEIIDIEEDFQLTKTVTCKSDLGYFNHSIVRPYSTYSDECDRTCPSTVNGYFEFLVEEHNSQASEARKFTIGINQGSDLDSSNYIYRSDTGYPTVGDTINDQLLSSIGGYLRTRYYGSTTYIDLLSDMPSVSSQVIDFGKNLLDFVNTESADDIATYVIPLGKTIENDSETEQNKLTTRLVISSQAVTDLTKEKGFRETELSDAYTDYQEAVENYNSLGDDATEDQIQQAQERVDSTYESYTTAYENYESAVSALNDAEENKSDKPVDDGYYKSGDIIYSEEAVKTYGWIGASVEFDDVNLVSSLISKGLLYLKSIESPIRTIEVKAIDLSLLDKDVDPIYVGDYVRVRSVPHKFDSYMLCTKIEYDLNNPDNNTFTLGTTFDTLTGQQNKRIRTLNSYINQVYEAANKISDEAKATALTAEQAQKAAASAVISIVEEFSVSTSPNSAPTDGWSTEAPEYVSDVFIWHRYITTYGDGKVVTGEPVVITGNKGADGEDAVLLRIESSRGTVFKNNSISTVLSAVIYKGSTRITDITKLREVFGSGAYLEWSWQKIDEQTFGVILSTDQMISQDGFALTISADEVDTKVTFMCELKM